MSVHSLLQAVAHDPAQSVRYLIAGHHFDPQWSTSQLYLFPFKSLNQVKKASKSWQLYKQVGLKSFDLVQSSGPTTLRDRLDELRIRVCCQRRLSQAGALWESKSQIAGLACQDTRYKGPVYQTARQNNNNNQSTHNFRTNERLPSRATQSAWVATRASPDDGRERIGYDRPRWSRLKPPMRSWRPSEWRDWSMWVSTQKSIGYSRECLLISSSRFDTAGQYLQP